jgi:hypothetical protein
MDGRLRVGKMGKGAEKRALAGAMFGSELLQHEAVHRGVYSANYEPHHLLPGRGPPGVDVFCNRPTERLPVRSVLSGDRLEPVDAVVGSGGRHRMWWLSYGNSLPSAPRQAHWITGIDEEHVGDPVVLDG